ncbi:TerB family tellurite resistance protein [Synechococcus sp. PCC 7336]|uniref:tellurite resistance TerB family protein n=1 Tax=Synechococcus sp. PCC 7336 TaxID=195250 RepID=UPI00034502B1|nr:TerB family tellurite resistance protein [Synechococcus sp. PCC 7336]
MLTTPPPPAISPKQMNILRAVTAMAWADGVLESQEIVTMADKLSAAFASSPEDRAALSTRIQDYFTQQIPLEEVLPLLPEESDRRLILKLGYLTIESSARTEGEPTVNLQELDAFHHLAELLHLPADVVHEVSEEAKAELGDNGADPLEVLVNGFSRHYA